MCLDASRLSIDASSSAIESTLKALLAAMEENPVVSAFDVAVIRSSKTTTEFDGAVTDIKNCFSAYGVCLASSSHRAETLTVLDRNRRIGLRMRTP